MRPRLKLRGKHCDAFANIRLLIGDFGKTFGQQRLNPGRQLGFVRDFEAALGAVGAGCAAHDAQPIPEHDLYGFGFSVDCAQKKATRGCHEDLLEVRAWRVIQ